MFKVFSIVAKRRDVALIAVSIGLAVACRSAPAPSSVLPASVARGPAISAEADRLVLLANDGSLVEPHLAVHPRDPGRMVAIAMKGGPGKQRDGDYGPCVTAFTSD
ncbi:MAG: hypothetical protein ACJ8AJ_12940, partial [Gemmatimonadaceae bacterium]